MQFLKRAAGVVASMLGWLLLGVRTVLELVGYSTLPDDLRVASRYLDAVFTWLLGVPWWAVLGVALASTLWLTWLAWRPSSSPASIHGTIAEKAGSIPQSILQGPTQTRTVYENEVVRLADLTRYGSPLISGMIFRRCVLQGPCVLKAQADVHLEFIAGPASPDALMFEIPEGRPIFGTVLLSRVTFTDCFLDNVVFCGTPEDCRQLRPAFHQEDQRGWQRRVGFGTATTASPPVSPAPPSIATGKPT